MCQRVPRAEAVRKPSPLGNYLCERDRRQLDRAEYRFSCTYDCDRFKVFRSRTAMHFKCSRAVEACQTHIGLLYTKSKLIANVNSIII